MMSKTPFMPLWVSDFVGDTLDLGAREVGAYMLLLMAMWARGGHLPNDQKKLQRVARVGRDWPKVWGAISHYFTDHGDTISNPRLLKELHKVDAKRAVNAHSGARGGRAKALKKKESSLANATNSLQQPEPEPESEEEYTTTTSGQPPACAREADPPDGVVVVSGTFLDQVREECAPIDPDRPDWQDDRLNEFLRSSLTGGWDQARILSAARSARASLGEKTMRTTAYLAATLGRMAKDQTAPPPQAPRPEDGFVAKMLANRRAANG